MSHTGLYLNKKIAFALAVVLIGLLLPSLGVFAQQGGEAGTVYVIPVKGEITPAMKDFLVSKIELANIEKADGILIEIDTLGGLVDSAVQMKKAILDSEVPVAVHIVDRAISAGSLISIAANTIIMAPGSVIGDAEPVPFSEKAAAYVRSEFRRTAEERGRNTLIAEAMVDKTIDIPGLAPEGKLLTMTANQAKEKGYADAVLKGREEVLDYLGWSSARLIESQLDYKFRIAGFLTRSEVASALITIGMIAFVVEIFTQGFGLAGIVGIICYALYFGGGLLSGSTEWWAIALFVVGVALMLAEIAVPGFGVLGISGILVMLSSLVFAAPDPVTGLKTVGISLILTIIFIPIFYKYMGGSKLFKRLVLQESMTTEKGYVSVTKDSGMVGKTGKALTNLRPSGTAEISGSKWDVVTEGEFISPGTEIKVIRVEGPRIVVDRI